MKGFEWIWKRDGLATTVLLSIVLGWMFREAWAPGMVVFSNDGPLSNLVAEYNQRPSAFFGVWQDTQWLGKANGAAPINLSWGLLSVMDPVTFAKIYPFLSLLFFGWSFWVFLKTLGLHPVARLLGSLAAALNSDFFSYVCWGLGPVALSGSFFLLALAALNTSRWRRPWARYVFSGAAIGLAVMEGFDAGAILAVYFAIYALVQALFQRSNWLQGLGVGALRVGLVAIIAAWVATQTLYSLVSTQVSDVSVLEGDSMNEQNRWDWATQWSLPIKEIPRLLAPGLFGYRMDTENGGGYFGAVGRSPGWESTGVGLARHSGSGFYVGVSVFVFAIWGVYLSFRAPSRNLVDRKWIWFWLAIALVSLALSLGRHFFLYKLFYQLPLASTIRNPIKFLHPMSLAWLVLAAYGLDSFVRSLFGAPGVEPEGGRVQDKQGWLARISEYERPFVKGALVTLLGALLLFMIVASNYPERVSHLTTVERLEPAIAQAAARFSLVEVGWSLTFLTAALGVVLWGALNRKGSAHLGRFFCLTLVLFALDLGRANGPWVVVYDQDVRYQEDALVRVLRERPYEGRVTIAPYRSPTMDLLNQVYRGEWLQHQFTYYNIQTLELSMEPRRNSDDAVFRAAFPFSDVNALAHFWRVTNTRFVLAEAEVVAERLNQDVTLDGVSFRPLLRFKVVQDTSGFIRTEEDPSGPFALLEFEGAVPRVQLFDRWKVVADERDLLSELSPSAYDPNAVVLRDAISREPNASDSVSPVGNAVIETYEPKDVSIRVTTSRPAILVLNDKYDSDWKIWVDGQSVDPLRANFIMRGVFLEAGERLVEMRYAPAVLPLKVTLVALALVVGFFGVCVWEGTRD